MRVLILCKDKPKKDSYSNNLLHLLLFLFVQKNYSVIKSEGLREAKKVSLINDNTVFIIEEYNSFLSFFNDIQLWLLLKKWRIDWLVQITKDKMVSSSLPQLIIATETERLVVKNKLASVVTIAVSSQFIKQKLLAEEHFSNNNIQVLQAAAENDFEPISWSEKQSLKMSHAQGKEYFLLLGKGNTLASFMSLLKAFSGFKKWQHSSMKLIVAGTISFVKEKEWIEKYNTYRYREDVVFLNTLSESEYAKILAGAYVFIHTPKRDDDIMPLLQSMQCQTPCISFITETIKEYAGNAAVLIEPDNYEQLSEKMILLYKDEALRNRLIEACSVQADVYSKKTALLQLETILPKSINK